MIKSVTQHSNFEKKPTKYMGRLQSNPSIGWVHPKSKCAFCLLFTVLHPFGTKKSIRRKVDHGKQIVFWY
jgi:hypothetical protein